MIISIITFCLASMACYYIYRYIKTLNAFKSDNSLNTKYVILGLACGFVYGSNVGYDTPATIYNFLDEYLGDEFNEMRYNMLYSAYSVPNILLPLYSGSMILRYKIGMGLGELRFGLYDTIIGLCSFVFFGVFLFGLGVQFKHYSVILLGRVLLGIGAECLAVVQSSFVTRYFLSSDLSFALSITMTVGRLSSVINYNLLPLIASTFGPTSACWFATGASIFSLVCAYLAIRLDRQSSCEADDEESDRGSADRLDEGVDKILMTDADPIVKRRSPSNTDQPRPETPVKGLTSSYSQKNGLLLYVLSSVLPAGFETFPITYWLLTIVFVSFSGSTINFLPLAPMFLQTKYFPHDKVGATSLVSLPDTLSVFLMPLIGYMTDSALSSRSRRQTQLLKIQHCIFSGVCILLAHYLFAYTYIFPLYPLFLLGIGYASYGASIYSLMGEFAIDSPGDVHKQMGDDEKESRVASAYGINGCIGNASFSLIPIVIGYLLMETEHSDRERYLHMETFFAALTGVGLIACFALRKTVLQY